MAYTLFVVVVAEIKENRTSNWNLKYQLPVEPSWIAVAVVVVVVAKISENITSD